MQHISQIYSAPIPYPGGKKWMLKYLLDWLPADTDAMVEPFMGGGAISANLQMRGIKCYGYDIDPSLINFWHHWIADKFAVASEAEKLLRTHDKDALKKLVPTFKTLGGLEGAGAFFACGQLAAYGITFRASLIVDYYYDERKQVFMKVVNRKSKRRSGKGQNGVEVRQVYNFINYPPTYKNIEVGVMPFEESLALHPDKFAFLDPPYHKTEDVYHTKATINHVKLHDILRTRDNWILTYGDDESVKKLYKDFYIKILRRHSGMKAGVQFRLQEKHKRKLINELVIFSHDIAEQVKRNDVTQLAFDI